MKTNPDSKVIMRILSCLLTMLLLFCLTCCGKEKGSSLNNSPYIFEDISDSYTDELNWTYGVNEQDTTQQGVDNWYYLYNEETNMNGVYDIENFKECTYSEEKLCWVTDNTHANPGRISVKNSNIEFHPTESASLSLAFKAPTDGSYSFEISFTAGNTSTTEGDGVTVSVYSDNSLLYMHNISDEVLQGETCELTANMKENEYCYFLVDPNEDSYYDFCGYVRIYVFQKFDKYVNNQTSWGIGEFYSNTFNQGNNNLYCLYTEETDTNGVYRISELKSSEFTASRVDAYTGETIGSWSPDIYKSAPETGLYLEEDLTGVIGFKAPQTGIYTIISEFIANPEDADSGDGITVSFYCDETLIKSLHMNEYGQKRYCLEVELKEDECFYLFADPNQNSGNDKLINFDLYIEIK